MKPPKEFAAALDWIVGCVTQMQPVVFARFHDGEYRVCTGTSYKAAAGWRSTRAAWLREQLFEALGFAAEGYVVGISPPCCAPNATNFYVRAPAPKTFATVFQNANYRKALVALSKVDAVVVGDHPDTHVKVPSNGVEKKWDLQAVVDELMTVEKPIFLAAGPVSCVLAHKLKLADVKVPVVDVGALFDNRTPRHYKINSPTQRHVCTWHLKPEPELKRVGGFQDPIKARSAVRRSSR